MNNTGSVLNRKPYIVSLLRKVSDFKFISTLSRKWSDMQSEIYPFVNDINKIMPAFVSWNKGELGRIRRIRWNQARNQAVLTVCSASLLLVSTGCAMGQGNAPTASAAEDRPTISIMAPLHFPSPPSNDIIDRIEQQTNTNVEITWVPDGVYSDKMVAALTTNSLKKATFVKFTDYIYMADTMRSGVFWDIGPYLDEFENLRHLDHNIMKQASVDGHIYGLYTERPSSRQGIIIRQDWLEHLHLKPPTTIDELYEVIRQFTYNDPDGDGVKNTIGLADRNDLVYGAFKTLGSYFGAPNNWQLQDGKFAADFETQAYVDTMDFMRKLYEEKLINSDFAVTSKDIQRNLLITGKAGVYIGSISDAQRLSTETVAVNPKATFTLVNRIEGPQGYRIWSMPNYNGLYLFSKKAIKTEDELREMLAYFDRSMEKDVANMMLYGLEGRHYEERSGMAYLPESTSELRISEVNALYTLMIADLSNPNVMKAAQKEPLTELADRLVADNEKFLVKDPSVSLHSKTYDEHGQELNNIITEATYNYMLGQIDLEGFKNEVDKWKRSGGTKVIDELQEQYEGMQ
ncbi:putative ABC transporter peptide-binding protein YtcQ [Paenibacillus sp. CCS19]|uniref:extracellular solute-binding protein n=1 Tax=Paenibacillus sp. CCS19 TaxID=3158387 RepID=UPI0025647E5F|nr:extracellular solute-binding protein [Paenibacillus cellulosilyticus]GMK38738.1 putative ABC transporter peptide-binding protein YtcQ [Paenibacillus cellulosilyticus]